ncbi:MAG: PDZ domain-containing protein [bacterium]
MQAFLLSRRFITAAVTLIVLGGTFAYYSQTADAKPAKKKRGWIGVSVQELTPSLRDALDLGNRSGLLINSVVEDSPAEDAGLQEEDVLLEFNGQKVERSKTLSRIVRRIDPGTDVKVKIFRDGEEKTIDLTVGRLKSNRAGVYSFGSGNNVFFVGQRPMLGVQVHEMDENLAAYFKVKKNEGVLVLGVNEDSPAEDAGLKAGDVILKIDGEPIGDYEELIEILADYEDGDEVDVEYIRQGKNATAAIELDAQGSGSWSWSTPTTPGIQLRRFGRDRKDIDIVIPELRERLFDMKNRLNEQKDRQRLLIRNRINLNLRNTI